MIAVGVGEGYVTDSHVVVAAQQAQAVFDGVAALGAQQRGECPRRW